MGIYTFLESLKDFLEFLKDFGEMSDSGRDKLKTKPFIPSSEKKSVYSLKILPVACS